jgi:acetyl-CoA acetyltransferase
MAWELRGKVAVIGYGETEVDRDKTGNLSIEQYLVKAANLAMESAGLKKKDFDEQGVGLMEPQLVHPMWSAQIIQDLGLHPRLVIRSDHGGAGPGHLLEQAAASIDAGLVDIFLCLGADAPLTYVPQTMTQRLVLDFMKPFGVMGPNSLFALIAQRYIHQYGVTPEQVAKIPVTQRHHATLNPLAYFNEPITTEEYLNSSMISDPIRLLDCCLPVNGGLAFIVTSVEKARDMTDKPVYLLGSGACYNYRHGDRFATDITYMGTVKAGKEAFEKAEISQKSDVSFLQLYDDYSYAVMMQLEDLGYCEKGEAGKFLEQVDISSTGELPINTGGGQLSSGQAGMAGGFHFIVEAVRQLRQEAGKRQVGQARLGVISLIGAITQYTGNLINSHVCILGREVP